ncbi:MAG: M81 family metallopeptidase [Bacteroidota bacterium]
MKKIAIVELHQETNSFSQVLTKRINFDSLVHHYDENVYEIIKKYPFQIAGFLKYIKKHHKNEVEAVPIMTAWSNSGGPIEKELFDYFQTYILEKLREQQWDGIYLSMHGAMGVEGIQDPESHLLGAVRDLVGYEIPIAVSLDLHANVTQKLVDQATFITAYRTNPHRDHFKVGFKTSKILVNTVLGNIKPVMAFRKMKLLKGGGFNIDFLKPMRSIFRAMSRMEKNKKVLSVGNFMVHLWIDEPEMGWSCIVVTDDDKELAEDLCEQLANRNWEVRDHKHPELDTPTQAIQKVKRSWLKRLFGTAIICDVSDLVAAGAPGENTHILRTLQQEANGLTVYIPLRDEEEVNRLYDRSELEMVEVKVGRKLDSVYNEEVQLKGQILKKGETEFGRTVVIKSRGIHLILTQLPCPIFRPSFFKELGLSLWKADITVVKNLFPFRLFFFLYNRLTVNVATAGITNVNVFELEYKHIPRPIYPLDDISDWK